jgi:uncharacterized protein
MLCDTGPLVALIDADDSSHEVCTRAAERMPPVMVTTWPCLTEAMHLLFRTGGLKTQNDLWAKVAEGIIKLHIPSESDWEMIQQLMNQYANLPLDLADASLVCAAEKMGDFQLFTIDHGMRVVRLQNGKFFDVLP